MSTIPIGIDTNSTSAYRRNGEVPGDHVKDPSRLAVGAGTAGVFVARRRVFAKQLEFQKRLGMTPVFATLEDFVEHSSTLISSPQQIIDKVHRYHKHLGHIVLHVHADNEGS
jgi:hypothetical protein